MCDTDWKNNEEKMELPRMDLGELNESLRDEFFIDMEEQDEPIMVDVTEITPEMVNRMQKGTRSMNLNDFVFVEPETKSIKYKFNELEILDEVRKYIDGTYSEHYAKEKNIQTAELIMAKPERGVGFCVGNILKYADRFGTKDGYNRKDILKVIHYAVMLLSIDLNDR